MEVTPNPSDVQTLHEAEKRFRSAFDASGIGMALLTLDLRFMQVNPALTRLLGWTAEELLHGEGVSAISHPDDMAARWTSFAELLAGEADSYYRADRRYLHADGHVIWGATTLTLIRDDDGQPLYAMGQLEDITARKHAEQRAERRAAQQSAVVRLSQVALEEQDFGSLADATVATITDILDVSVAALARCGSGAAPLQHVSGATGSDVAGRGAASLDERHALLTLDAGEPVIVCDSSAEARFDAGGLAARGLASGVTVRVAGEGHEPFGVLGMYAARARAFDEDDIAFLRSVANVLTGAVRRLAAERGMRHQALHDPLTHLPNRALLLDRLRHGLARGRREGRWLAVLHLDVDDFKNVNDAFGHAAGDDLLRELAPRLSEALRPSDTLARFSGDEFAIVCDGLDDATESATIAQRLLRVVERPFEVAGVEVQATASIGIALAEPGAAAGAEELLRDADVAVHRAKAGGHGTYEIFDERMRAETLERVALTKDLRRAIEDGGLRLVYQPIVSFHDRRVVGVEALTRWTHPDWGDVPPDRFIPLAEQHGLIGALGRWVLHEALDQLVRWERAGLARPDLTVSVNVSRVQLGSAALGDEVLAALSLRELAPNRLIVEVTESAVMDDPETARATLAALHQRGVRLALDDFGVGQSSLACLLELPLDVLKLDRGFITSLATSRESAAIVRAVADMARTLRFPVVAEGIETAAQEQVVEALGCDLGQGFLYARPVDPEALPAVVADLDAALGRPAARAA
ncbi:MAG TPA: EAL domain-containing protein [Baekduia sp.]|nr:EAL domain-containing protein [Baekduia sp.]